MILAAAYNEAKKGTCRRRNYGAVIVKGEHFSSGFTSSIDGQKCKRCLREELNVPSGQRYELCNSIHAEQMALLTANFKTEGATIYLSGIENNKEIDNPMPCLICLRMLVFSGVKTLINNKGSYNLEVLWNERKTK